jgi:hypothetical protein
MFANVVGSKAASLLLTPPPGATGALLICNSTGGAQTLTGVTALGQTSGYSYTPAALNTISLAGPAAFACSLPGAYEEIEFSLVFLNAPALGAVVGELIWLFGSEVVYPVVPIDQPLYVRGTRANATNNADQIVTGAFALLGPTGIDQIVREEAPADLYTSNGDVSWATGATQIVAGVTGESIRIRGGYWSPGAAGTTFCLRETVNGLEFNFMGGAANAPWPIDLKGWALPAGADLQLVNDSGGVAVGTLQVLYDLY